ncbi:MAG: TetR/AcrR family transcriptional regulator [Bacteroidales bacterium]|nr:TetR/AcrR family transcriptional regulator [Bacteroidales bacterium]
MTSNRLSRPHDARAQRSRKALQQALLQLVEQKPLDQITIREITTQAGVSYPTFFRQFANRDELLADIAKEEIHRLISFTWPLFDSTCHRTSLQALCDYIDNHRALWTALLTTGAASAMRSEFIRIALDISQSGKRMNPWLPADLSAPFVTGAILEILTWWLRQPAAYPIDNVITLLDVLVVSPAVRPFDFQT